MNPEQENVTIKRELVFTLEASRKAARGNKKRGMPAGAKPN